MTGPADPVPGKITAAALCYLVANAAGLRIDPGRFVLAGDSVGPRPHHRARRPAQGRPCL